MKTCLSQDCALRGGYKRDEEEFCSECGHPLHNGEFPCPKCKKVIPLSDKFCRFCGVDLEIGDEETEKEVDEELINKEFKQEYHEQRMK